MRRRRFLGAAAGFAALPFPAARARQTGYGPLGEVEIGNAAEAVVGADGGIAFVAAGTGFAVVDVSDPTSPAVIAEHRDLLGERDDGPMEGIIDIKVDGNRLVVPGPGNPTGADAITGFILYDVGEPSDPVSLAFHETSSPIHNAFIEGDRVYLTQGDSIDIVDVSNDNPVAAGSFSITDFQEKWSDVNVLLRRPHDVWVQDHVAYVPMWEAGTWIVDVGDADSPEPVAHVPSRPFGEVASIPSDETERASTEPPGNHHYAQPSADGRLLAIGKESWDAIAGDDSGGPSGIEFWDVSSPSSPLKLSEIHPPRTENETLQGTWTTSHNFDLVGDRLYSSWYQGGLKIHDVSDPGAPVELAWWREPERAAFWTAVRPTEDVLVASSTGGVGPTITEGLFTFSTAPAEQSDPPSTPVAAATPQSFATARPTPTPTSTPTSTDRPTTTESAGQPGFGLLVGIAGAAAGVGWLRRGCDRDES